MTKDPIEWPEFSDEDARAVLACLSRLWADDADPDEATP